MKTVFIIILMFGGYAAAAQTPVPNADTVDPVQQGDPAVRHLPPRADYVDDRRRIGQEELPEAVKRSVESVATPEQLEHAVLFHDRRHDEYIVEIHDSEMKDADTKTTYRFDANGRRIMEQ